MHYLSEVIKPYSLLLVEPVVFVLVSMLLELLHRFVYW